jgi:hypothetical protein
VNTRLAHEHTVATSLTLLASVSSSLLFRTLWMSCLGCVSPYVMMRLEGMIWRLGLV